MSVETFVNGDLEFRMFLRSRKGSSFLGDSGGMGMKASDGSGSYYGSDGSWGLCNSDRSGPLYFDDNSMEQIESMEARCLQMKTATWDILTQMVQE